MWPRIIPGHNLARVPHVVAHRHLVAEWPRLPAGRMNGRARTRGFEFETGRERGKKCDSHGKCFRGKCLSLSTNNHDRLRHDLSLSTLVLLRKGEKWRWEVKVE